MRIGFWADNVADEVRSGMAYYQHELLRAMDRLSDSAGWFIFHTRNDGHESERMPQFQRLEVHPLPGRRIRLYPMWHAVQWPKIDRLLPQADLLHLLHASVTVPVRTPRIISVVDLASLRLPEAYSRRRAILKHAALERAASDPAVTFTAISHFVKNDLCAAYDVEPNRVEVVWLGVDHDRFHTVTKEEEFVRVRARYSLERPYFLSVGMLSPRKNVDTLIAGFAEFKRRTDAPHTLVLAGPRGWDFEDVERAATATADVQLIGFVEDADLTAVYAGADAFVFPSSYEGFGLPLLEAMACGTPVLASPLSCFPEILGGAGRLLEEVSPPAIADGMERLASDERLRDNLRRRGLARAAVFTWERAAKQCIALYERRLRGEAPQ